MHIFTLVGFNDNKILLKYFYVLIFCSRRAFQQRITVDIDNQTVASDMAYEKTFTASNFWTDYSSHMRKRNPMLSISLKSFQDQSLKRQMKITHALWNAAIF